MNETHPLPPFPQNDINPFRTAAPFWGQTSQIPSSSVLKASLAGTNNPFLIPQSTQKKKKKHTQTHTHTDHFGDELFQAGFPHHGTRGSANEPNPELCMQAMHACKQECTQAMHAPVALISSIFFFLSSETPAVKLCMHASKNARKLCMRLWRLSRQHFFFNIIRDTRSPPVRTLRTTSHPLF